MIASNNDKSEVVQVLLSHPRIKVNSRDITFEKY